MPHIIRKPGILGGTTLAVFMTLVHTVNDAMTAILGALLPTLQVRFDAGPTALALMIAVFWIASSVTQPVFGYEDAIRERVWVTIDYDTDQDGMRPEALEAALENLEAHRLREMGYTGTAKKPWEQAIRQQNPDDDE